MKSFDFFILGIIIGVFLFYKFSRYYRHKKRLSIIRKAKRAENLAVKLLQDSGYKIIDVQKRVKVKTKIDGKIFSNTIIADMLVRKGRKTYLVEIKTGKQVEKLITPLIRRQLLEYYLVFKPDGLILVDMEKRKLHQVSFELDKPSLSHKLVLSYVLAFLFGVFSVLLFILLKR